LQSKVKVYILKHHVSDNHKLLTPTQERNVSINSLRNACQGVPLQYKTIRCIYYVKRAVLKTFHFKTDIKIDTIVQFLPQKNRAYK